MTEARPYPNVRPSKYKPGWWEARHPRNGHTRHLGTFRTPELARRAVLLAQAEHLEAKAANYRAEARALFAEPVLEELREIHKWAHGEPSRMEIIR